jgi:hypothetical protein
MAVPREISEEREARVAVDEQKLSGAGFVMMMMLALFKDFFDVIANFSIILAFLSTITGIIVSFVIFFYLFYNNVSFTSKKLGVLFTMLLIETVPFLSLLPMTAAGLFIVRLLEHRKTAKQT